MKKLMIAAAAVVAVGGAFAEPLVYDYKASVKHMYEKEQRLGAGTIYVKYVKSAKLQGYFIQDYDATTLLANTEGPDQQAAVSQKKGFLVLINKSAEKDFRAPKIMPAQLDVKTAITSQTTSGSTTKTKVVAEAYFYAGPFAAFPDTNNGWDATFDDSQDYLFANGVATANRGIVRAYGTVGSTLFLFGQHNTYNRYTNVGTLPAGSILAFGDAWMNGAGFGNGSGKATLCCGWGAVDGGFGAISGNLKGGLFLCSISGYPANTALGYFALGLEDVFKSDVGAANLAKTVQGDLVTPEDPEDEVTWADGDIALSTSDVVSGTWTLKPAARLEPVALTAAEQAFFPSWPACAPVAEYIKGANRALDRNYSLTTTTEPSAANGKPTRGLISTNFGLLYL